MTGTPPFFARPFARALRRVGAALAFLSIVGIAHSHDSWLATAPAAPDANRWRLELGTGNRFPVRESGTASTSVVQAQCTDGQRAATPLRPAREQPKYLELTATPPATAPGLLACWLELAPYEVDLKPELVEVYFRELQASAFHRSTWAAMQARQLPWHERYRKFARIETAGASSATPAQLAAARRPAGLALELVPLGDQPIGVGRPQAFQLLRDGQPLADFPIELISERNPLGIWRRTDADGKLLHTLPFGGTWLLRGIDLRLSTDRPDTWDSRFVTLSFEVR